MVAKTGGTIPVLEPKTGELQLCEAFAFLIRVFAGCMILVTVRFVCS